MINEKNLNAEVLIAGATGDLEKDAAHAILDVLSGQQPLIRLTQSKSQKKLGMKDFYKTLDTDGNVLVAGENYTFRGNKVKVLREQFGGGNILDVYMRVFYLNRELEEDFTIVDGKYPQGVFNGAIFRSDFEPIKKE